MRYTLFFLFINTYFFVNGQVDLDFLKSQSNKYKLFIESYNDSLENVNALIDSVNYAEVYKTGIFTKTVSESSVYKDASFSNRMNYKIPKNSRIEVIGYEGTLWKIKYQNDIGFVFGSNIEVNDTLIFFRDGLEEERRQVQLRKTQESMDKAQSYIDSIKAKRDSVEQVLLKIKSTYSKTIQDRIDKNQYWIGMTKTMATLSLGNPSDINRTVTKFVIHEQWVYSDYGLYLYFDDGILTSFQD